MGHINYEEIHDGVSIFQRGDTKNGVWYVRIKVGGPKRYKIQSTGEKSKTLATAKATQLWHTVLGLKAVNRTEEIWTRNFDDVAKEYQKWIAEQVRIGVKTATGAKLGRAKTHVPKWIRYMGNISITQITMDKVRGYEPWRRTEAPTLAHTSMEHEYTAYRDVMNYAIEKRYITADRFIKPDFKVDRKDKGRRDGFSKSEFEKLRKSITPWVKNAPNKKQGQRREMMRYIVDFLAGSGLRLGELRALKWADQHVTPDGHLILNITDSKQYPNKSVAMMISQNALFLWKKITKYNKDTDYIFTSESGGMLGDIDDQFTGLLHFADLHVGPAGKPRTLYSLRHYYATERLEEGEMPIDVLSQNMRTDIKQIQQHYGHTDAYRRRAMLTRTIAKPIVVQPPMEVDISLTEGQQAEVNKIVEEAMKGNIA